MLQKIIISFYFSPKIGDTVAVFREDSDETNWVRGLVLSIKGNKYDLALIDYGIIVTSEKIYPLEKEFEDIVEFSCLCKVDSQYMQEIVEVFSLFLFIFFFKFTKFVFNFRKKRSNVRYSKTNT